MNIPGLEWHKPKYKTTGSYTFYKGSLKTNLNNCN